MPLVPLEIALHTPELRWHPCGDSSSRGWVIHTRPRAEEVLARHSPARNLSFFLPSHNRQWLSRCHRFCPPIASSALLTTEERLERLNPIPMAITSDPLRGFTEAVVRHKGRLKFLMDGEFLRHRA